MQPYHQQERKVSRLKESPRQIGAIPYELPESKDLGNENADTIDPTRRMKY